MGFLYRDLMEFDPSSDFSVAIAISNIIVLACKEKLTM